MNFQPYEPPAPRPHEPGPRWPWPRYPIGPAPAPQPVPGARRARITGWSALDADRFAFAAPKHDDAARDLLHALGTRPLSGEEIEAHAHGLGPLYALRHDHRIATHHAPAVLWFLSNAMDDDPALAARVPAPDRHDPDHPLPCPSLFTVRAHTAGRTHGALARAGARSVRLDFHRAAQRSTKGTMLWHLWLAPPRAPWSDVARAAGLRWHEASGAWATPSLRLAAALGAYADPGTAELLAKAGVPRVLQQWLRYAPALIPWRNRYFALVGAQHYEAGWAHPQAPGARWNQTTTYEGWVSADPATAHAFREFAPRALHAALESSAANNQLATLTPRALELHAVREADAAAGIVPPQRKRTLVRLCRQCRQPVVLDPSIVPGKGRPCEDPACRARAEQSRGAAPRIGLAAADLFAFKHRASAPAWRHLTEALFRDHALRARASSTEVSSEEIDRATPPRARLRPGQPEAIGHAVANPVSLNATPMGGGKTIVTNMVANVLALRTGRPAHFRALYTVKAGLRANWERETSRWLHHSIPRCVLGAAHQALPRHGVIIASYEGVRNRIAELATIPFDLIAADEAHQAKNARALRSRALFSLEAPRWLFLTATPNTNRLNDMQAYMARAAPQVYDSPGEFARAYRVEDPKALTPAETAMAQRLSRLLRETILYRPALADVLEDLPPRAPDELVFADGTEQGRLREKERAELARLHAARLAGPALLAQLSHLRQEVGLSKIPVVMDQLRALHAQRCPALVFCVHHSVTERIAEIAGEEGIRCATLYGALSASQRHASERAFQNGALDALVLTIEVGGEGLNLPQAAAVLFAEIDCSPTKMVQAVGRAYRPGQTRRLRTIYVVVPDSIDHYLAALCTGKAQLHAAALGDNSAAEIMRSMNLAPQREENPHAA